MRREARENRIPHYRFGRYVRFEEEEEIVAWLEGQRAGQWRKHRPVTSARPSDAADNEGALRKEAPGGGR